MSDLAEVHEAAVRAARAAESAMGPGGASSSDGGAFPCRSPTWTLLPLMSQQRLIARGWSHTQSVFRQVDG